MRHGIQVNNRHEGDAISKAIEDPIIKDDGDRERRPLGAPVDRAAAGGDQLPALDGGGRSDAGAGRDDAGDAVER